MTFFASLWFACTRHAATHVCTDQVLHDRVFFQKLSHCLAFTMLVLTQQDVSAQQGCDTAHQFESQAEKKLLDHLHVGVNGFQNRAFTQRSHTAKLRRNFWAAQHRTKESFYVLIIPRRLHMFVRCVCLKNLIINLIYLTLRRNSQGFHTTMQLLPGQDPALQLEGKRERCLERGGVSNSSLGCLGYRPVGVKMSQDESLEFSG